MRKKNDLVALEAFCQHVRKYMRGSSDKKGGLENLFYLLFVLFCFILFVLLLFLVWFGLFGIRIRYHFFDYHFF